MADVPAHRKTVASYEGMTRDTETELGHVLDFIGVGIDAHHLQRTSEGVSLRPSKRLDLSDAELDRIREITSQPARRP